MCCVLGVNSAVTSFLLCHTHTHTHTVPPRIITNNNTSSTIAILGSNVTLQCITCSFPPATVEWEMRNPAMTDMTQNLSSLVHANVSEDDPDCSNTFTIAGQIEFDNVEYSDAAIYMCRAVNEYSMRRPPELTLRLRVHSKSFSN